MIRNPQFHLGALFMVLLMAPPVLTGCWGNGTPVDTPQKRAELAKDAGELAALGYLAIDKPSNEDAAKIKEIIDKVRGSLTEWKEGGFITALPELEELADKLFEGEDKKALRIGAKKLTKMLLEELDNLFEKNPSWKDKGDEVATLIGKFMDGASDSFKTYIES